PLDDANNPQEVIKQQKTQIIWQLNDLMFTLENQRKLRNGSTQDIDYSLVDQLLAILQLSVPSSSPALERCCIKFKALKIMASEPVVGRFEWIDGFLINALEEGHWLLIDNANLCNPSVLD